MIISIINASNHNRWEVQKRIRAVNRQLQEDVRRYWHIDVRLRLEGWTGANPDPQQPLNMRGDAVIYLWDHDNTAAALGYHHLTHHGVPFGFVFTHLSKHLDEDWSVTLSHEALEMALDPQINCLVQGPHPDPREGGRMVYHWYELCDAVQSDTYSIDGIEVSNFVLPLYFTHPEEHLNHNDFLGLGIQSFGVRPGGYVGFFDPAKERHDTYHRPDDEGAKRRRATKARFANAKRSGRRGGSAAGDMLNDPQWVTCDAISFELKVDASGASPSLAGAQRVADKYLKGSWLLRTCKGDPKEFDAIYDGKLPLTFADAWELVHAIHDDNEVLYAEPSFTFPVPGETDSPDDSAYRRSSSYGNADKAGTEHFLWALQKCNVPAAWGRLAKHHKRPGQDVRIGHPDSGFVEHHEMDLERVLVDFDRDFLEEDFETRTKKTLHGLHGLATASVIMSGGGRAGDQVLGPARCAKILPLRVTKPGLFPAPVLMSGGMRRLRDAIDYASEHGCQVVSISLGGFAHQGLHKAIKRANHKGVIVCAAAGNHVDWVVSPANYDETIAVAGCDIHGAPWEGSCRGPAVNVTAPAESVWRATVCKDGTRTAARGYGTSYAVALTAGIAALWLSFHSDGLKKIDPATVPELFRQLLEKTASTNYRLPQKKFGAGIVDADALLCQPIPKPTSGTSIVGKRVNPNEAAFQGKPGKLRKLKNIDDTLRRELLCAKALVDLIDASQPFPPGRQQIALRQAARLSTKLTSSLEKAKISVDELFR